MYSLYGLVRYRTKPDKENEMYAPVCRLGGRVPAAMNSRRVV